MNSMTAVDIDKVSDILQKHKSMPGAMLPILHAIQQHFGYVPETTVPMIASSLNQSRAEVHGVISFYHHFLPTKPGQNQISICRGISRR